MAVITFQDFQGGIDRRKSEQVSDDRGLYECKNAYITTGFGIKKRPGFEKVVSSPLSSSSKGLFMFDRILYTVSHAAISQPTLSGFGINGPIRSTIENLVLPNPADAFDEVSRVWQFLVFNRKLYVVVEYNSGDVIHWYGGTTTAGMSRITDTNCPNTKSVIVHGSKVYAIGTNASGQAYVKYSATEDPTDWTSKDNASGTLGLPVGLESPQQDEVVALGAFRDKLVVFMTNNLQLWNTDPDPAKISLDSVIENAHAIYVNSIAPIGNDLFYLNDSGFDSAAQMLYTDTVQDVDVGSPIADLVVSRLTSHADTNEPKAINFTGEGQYLCAVEKEIFVFSYSASSKLSAWSRYMSSDTIRDLTHFRNYCFLRMSNSANEDYIYSMNPDKYIDDTDGEAPEVQIMNSYQTLGSPGMWKKIYGMNAMIEGTANIQHRWDSRTPDEKTIKVELTGDSRPAELIPVELMTTELSFDITQAHDSAFQLNGISYYFQPLGEF